MKRFKDYEQELFKFLIEKGAQNCISPNPAVDRSVMCQMLDDLAEAIESLQKQVDSLIEKKV